MCHVEWGILNMSYRARDFEYIMCSGDFELRDFECVMWSGGF